MAESKLDGKVEGKRVSSVLAFVDIWMDGYDDVFSDFDPAPYSKRAVSADFIDEVMRRTSEDKNEDFSLRMSVPQALRSQKSEATIKKRLREHFSLRKAEYDRLVEGEWKKGVIYFISGVVLLSLLILLEASFAGHITVKLLSTVMAPLGWFGVWGGTSHMLEGPDQFKKKQGLYTKLSKAKFKFFSEEELTGLVREAEEAKASEAVPPKEERKKA